MQKNSYAEQNRYAKVQKTGTNFNKPITTKKPEPPKRPSRDSPKSKVTEPPKTAKSKFSSGKDEKRNSNDLKVVGNSAKQPMDKKVKTIDEKKEEAIVADK